MNNQWKFSFNTACSELGIFQAREQFHAFVGSGQVRPLTWWREQWDAYCRATTQAEDARDERETQMDALR